MRNCTLVTAGLFSLALAMPLALGLQSEAAPSTQPLAGSNVAESAAGWLAFGQALTMDESKTVTVEAVLADPAAFAGKAVRLSGAISKVCKPKGCWMQFTAPATEKGKGIPVFVKFTCPIDGRLIPLDAVGKQAIVEGTLDVVEISEVEARHYLEDEGASAQEIAKIVGPQKQVRVQGPGALVKQ